MRLIAKRPVLYRSKQYRAGDALPADNQAMVEAWLDAKSAAWEGEADDAQAEPVKPEPAKAATKKPAKAKATGKKGTKK